MPISHLESRKWLSTEYHDLNGTYLDVLESPPTALEFSRLIRISRPVVIKGYDITASAHHWTDEYLTQTMKDRPISIAVTPNGAADAITRGPDGLLYFAEPHVETLMMAELLSKLNRTKEVPEERSEVCYLQSQNGNVYTSRHVEGSDAPSEFEPLRKDIPSEVPWCTQALDKLPDAVNLWIGGGQSVTSIHSDPYENIYTVVRGEKRFTLLPPSDGWCLKEKFYPHAAYIRSSPASSLILTASSPETPLVRWSSITDPGAPNSFPEEVHPFHVTLRAGETLYLPAGWWHHVAQSDTEVTIALNWWYDIEMQGMSWALLSFLRGVEDVPSGNSDEED